MQVGELEKEKSFKLLGIELDSLNSFKYHVQKVHRKIISASTMIKRSKNHLPYRMKLLLYNALIMSNINYCSSVWSEPTVYTKKLETAQKRAIRIVSNAKYNQHTQPLFAKSRTLALEHQFELNLLKLGNSIISKQEPEPVLEIFPLKAKSKTRSGDK